MSWLSHELSGLELRQSGAASVSASLLGVVHGIPGATVDVYVNDALFLEDFEPESVAGSVVLPAGAYDIVTRS